MNDLEIDPASGPRIADGGLSSELDRLGAPMDPPLWTSTAVLLRPELVEAAHRRFIASGARIVLTATYQLSQRGLTAAGYSERADVAARSAVSLVRAAADAERASVAVWLSLGPHAALLGGAAEYTGRSAPPPVLAAAQDPRLAFAARAGADAIVVETLPTVAECIAAAEAAAHHAADQDVWFSFTCGPDGLLRSGEPVGAAVAAIGKRIDPAGFGVNCTAVADTTAALRAVRAATTLPIIAKPNVAADEAGPTTEDIARWVGPEIAVAVIGGCCGVDGPALAAIAAQVAEINRI